MIELDIKKIENSEIRRHWDENSNQYYFSIIDIIAIVTNSSDPRNYWKVLKSRLKNTQKELVTECNQLKMKASDGKFYLTDTANKKTLLQIIKIISPSYVEVFDLWFTNKETEMRLKESNSTISNVSTNESNNFRYLSKDESYPHSELLIDAYQTNEEIIITAFVAGIAPKNLFISLTSKEIIISGKREIEENDLNYLQQELHWAEFSRTITLPDDIEINKAEATTSHGLLKIKLPKINKSLRKFLEIKFT